MKLLRKDPYKKKDGTYSHFGWFEFEKDGVLKRVTVGTFPSDEELVQEYCRILPDYVTDAQKKAAVQGHILVSKAIEDWLEVRRPFWAPKTCLKREQQMRMHVTPTFDPLLRMNELDASHIKACRDALYATPLGYATKKHIWEAVNAFLNYSVDATNLLLSNPAKGIIIERFADEVEEVDDDFDFEGGDVDSSGRVKCWPSDIYPILLAASEGSALDALIVLGLLCGIRPGEVAGLQWGRDINVKGLQVVIRKADRDPATRSTKNKKTRTITVSPYVMRRLLAIQARQEPGEKYVQTLAQRTARELLEPFCVQLGIKALPPHSLRHTFATEALANGESVADVAAMIGDTLATTLKYYVHSDAVRVAGISDRLTQMAVRPTNPLLGLEAPQEAAG